MADLVAGVLTVVGGHATAVALVGRDEALGRFAGALLRRASETRPVTGDAGIGKSRLVLEACRHL